MVLDIPPSWWNAHIYYISPPFLDTNRVELVFVQFHQTLLLEVMLRKATQSVLLPNQFNSVYPLVSTW